MVEALDATGCKYEIDFTSIKGFEYYTGLCFKIRAGDQKVCSGGRYDNLINLVGGRNTPACGFAFYLDKLATQVKPLSRQKAEKTAAIKASGNSSAVVKSAFALAKALRNAGLIAELDFSGSQLSARWIITVNAHSRGYSISDALKGKVYRAPDIASVIDVIGGYAKGAR